MFYEDPNVYIEDASELKLKIERIDIILNGLYDALQNSLTKTHLLEYQIDDGQSRIRTAYRSVADMEKGILGFEKLKVVFISRLNKNRVFNLRSGDSIC